MKRLTEDQTRIFFDKLIKYIGNNVKLLIDRQDGIYCFRIQKDRVYYMPENLLKIGESIDEKHIISMGVCFGKFTKSKKFLLHITALYYLAPYAVCKIWLKANAVQQFAYGNNVTKSGLLKITDNTPAHTGVIVLNEYDTPIGFGVTGKSTEDCKNADPLSVICYQQADIGEYIRSEDDI